MIAQFKSIIFINIFYRVISLFDKLIEEVGDSLSL